MACYDLSTREGVAHRYQEGSMKGWKDRPSPHGRPGATAKKCRLSDGFPAASSEGGGRKELNPDRPGSGRHTRA